jgi:hypothetical protein
VFWVVQAEKALENEEQETEKLWRHRVIKFGYEIYTSIIKNKLIK